MRDDGYEFVNNPDLFSCLSWKNKVIQGYILQTFIQRFNKKTLICQKKKSRQG